MTALEREYLKQIERDRRTREAGLQTWLLSLAKRALRRTRNAIRLGVGWLNPLRGVYRGDPALDLPDPAGFLARGMADTHAAAVRRVGRMAGAALPLPAPLEDLAELYAAPAADALDATVDALAAKVDARLIEAIPTDAIAADLAAATEAFRTAGYTPDNPYGAERAATTAVLTAYGNGMVHAYGHPVVAEMVRGLRFTATLDEVTTDICRARHGIKLPIGHPYLDRNAVPLHFNCRSVWLPILREFEPTSEWKLWAAPPPAPGFGQTVVNVPSYALI